MELVHQPARSNRLGDFLQANLVGSWHTFRAAVAFVRRSGTRHLVTRLREFSKTKRAELIVGIDLQGTSKEGLEDLLHATGPGGRVLVFHNAIAATFHPKIYLFKSDTAAEVLIGSGNLTEGGLFTNYEASVRLRLDLTNQAHNSFLTNIESVLDVWADLSSGTALVLDESLLTKLVALGYVPVEVLSAPEVAEESIVGGFEEQEEKASEQEEVEPVERLFASLAIPRAPSPPAAETQSLRTPTSATSAPSPGRLPAPAAAVTGFVMTLQQTDVGVGQTTRGTSRRSPEIFIPLAARDAEPEFWGWDDQFVEDRTKPGKFDRTGVKMRLGTETVTVNMMTWPDKHDFRLRSEALRSAGDVGDILRIEEVDPSSGFEYYVEVIPQGTTQYAIFLALCTNPVRNSRKRYGYY
jgi:HKD family nuclease